METTVSRAQDVVLALEDITRRFPGVTALNRVGVEIRKKEILGLVGENGAGKSVLTKIMIGIYPPDEGRISCSTATRSY